MHVRKNNIFSYRAWVNGEELNVIAMYYYLECIKIGSAILQESQLYIVICSYVVITYVVRTCVAQFISIEPLCYILPAYIHTCCIK